MSNQSWTVTKTLENENDVNRSLLPAVNAILASMEEMNIPPEEALWWPELGSFHVQRYDGEQRPIVGALHELNGEFRAIPVDTGKRGHNFAFTGETVEALLEEGNVEFMCAVDETQPSYPDIPAMMDIFGYSGEIVPAVVNVGATRSDIQRGRDELDYFAWIGRSIQDENEMYISLNPEEGEKSMFDIPRHASENLPQYIDNQLESQGINVIDSTIESDWY